MKSSSFFSTSIIPVSNYNNSTRTFFFSRMTTSTSSSISSKSGTANSTRSSCPTPPTRSTTKTSTYTTTCALPYFIILRTPLSSCRDYTTGTTARATLKSESLRRSSRSSTSTRPGKLGTPSSRISPQSTSTITQNRLLPQTAHLRLLQQRQPRSSQLLPQRQHQKQENQDLKRKIGYQKRTRTQESYKNLERGSPHLEGEE